MKTQNNHQQEIRDTIIKMFDIDKLPLEKQEEMISRIGALIFQGVLLKVLPLLSEEEYMEYEKILERNPAPEEIFNFFFDKVPSFLEIVVEESNAFKKDATEVLSQVNL